MSGKARLGTQGFTLLIASATMVVSYAIAEVLGPVPVWVGLEKSAFIAPPWYMATAAFPFGVLVAESLIDFRYNGFRADGLYVILSLVLIGLVHSVKWLVPLPLSGHGLILGYFLLHEMQERREGRGWKLLVGTGVLVQAAWYKLVLWSDPASLLVGLGLGSVVWSVQLMVMLLIVRRRET